MKSERSSSSCIGGLCRRDLVARTLNSRISRNVDAGLDGVARQPEDFEETAVDHLKPVLRVEQA